MHPRELPADNSGELRNCRKVADKLSKSCPEAAPGAQTRPKIAQVSPTEAICLPNLAKFGQHLANFGQTWPVLAKACPNMVGCGQTLSNIGQIWSTIGNMLWPNLARLGKSMAPIGQNWPNVGRVWVPKTALDNLSATSAVIGHSKVAGVTIIGPRDSERCRNVESFTTLLRCALVLLLFLSSFVLPLFFKS